MYFIDERIQTICNQLKNFRFLESRPIDLWQYKHGLYLRPEEADRSPLPWQDFDCRTMRWYAYTDGSAQGKFKGQQTGYLGIPGEHYWFHTQVTVPEEFEGRSLWFHISTQIDEWDDAKNPQFLVFFNGQVVQGADMNHREILVSRKAKGGETLTIDVQAYTGICHMEFAFKTSFYTLDEEINRLYYDILVPLEAFPRMGKDNRDRLLLQTVLNDTINLLDLRTPYSEDFYASIRRAQAYITENLYEKMTGDDSVIATCIGHTHIDVAWWWTVAQTREKVVRSFATVLKLMEEYPNYKFMSSSPVLYEFLKQRYPELYEKIRDRIRQGRWEAEGGMWLEADCNLTSGESLVRQFLHGKAFFKEEFGIDSRILWLPDVFGYSGALPQIMKQCGVDYFMTTKLAWNQINQIPNDTFLWRGIDGTEVLTHLVTTLGIDQDPKESFFTTYNGMLHPGSIMGGWERYQNKQINNDILISYGYGDGGGGPTREMLETSQRMEKGIRGIPKVRQETALTYFEELDKRVRDNPRLETWEGEFYFEYHRGTYTSMARNKRSNRKSELMMMDLELLGLLAGDYPAEQDHRLWQDIILLNQFHDILPGSSIAEVYEVTKKEYEALSREVRELTESYLQKLSRTGEGITLLNTLGFQRSDVADLGDFPGRAITDGVHTYPVQQTRTGAIAYVEDLPSKGTLGFRASEASFPSPFTRTDDLHLETPFYRVTLDPAGRICSLFDKQEQREICAPGKALNSLMLYEDKPIYYDNWDIDMYYTEKSWPVDQVTEFKWIEDGPVRTTLELTYRCCSSTISQRVRFYADLRRIDFETVADWREHQHLLKAEFPVDIHSDEATFEVQFGNVKRKVHRNTSWDQARFESCAHRWMDFSEGHYGVSLLNDCKYGHSVRDGVLGLTLIKCGIEPNPHTDDEIHHFTYSLYPHQGTWQQAGTLQEAAKLNQPAYRISGGRAGEKTSFASVDRSNVILETVKQAENGEGTVLRLYESENARTRFTLTLPEGTREAYLTDLLEQPQEKLEIRDGQAQITVKPFQILTVLVK